jgi:uncharacterized SAM-binding protein YcdF (DUF218 family)
MKSIFLISYWFFKISLALGVWLYCLLFLQMAMSTHYFLKPTTLKPADAILVLGNRAYFNKKPNPCLTGRVDQAIVLARQGLANTIVMSGGKDHEDNAIESAVMQDWAMQQGFTGSIIQESASQSTLENLKYSKVILQSIPAQSVIIVSEPYHLWRTQWLVHKSGFDQHFIVQYSAANSQCWQKWGFMFKGVFREPLARVNNEWRFIFLSSTP